MKIFIIDASKFTSKQAAHEQIADALSFPQYYGKNLDALADSLSELPRASAVIMTNAALSEYADSLVAVFEEILKPDGRFISI